MSEAPRQYRLDQLSVPRLFFALLRNRFTGTLSLPQVTPEPGERTVWFRGGMPIFTDWVSPPDVLSEVMLAKAMASPEAIQQALVAMARDGGLLGQALVAAGAIDLRTLSEGLRAQCTRKLVHSFALREGVARVEAVEHGLGKGDELSGQVNVLRLIHAGVVRHYDEARVRAEMGEVLAGPIATSPAFPKYKGQFGFRDEDLVVIQQLQRGTAFADLAVPGLSRKRIALLVYVAWACQMLVHGDDAAQVRAKSGAAPPPPPAGAKKKASADRKPAAPPPAPQDPPKAAPKPATPDADQPAVTRSAPPASGSEDAKKIPSKLMQTPPKDGGDSEFEQQLEELESKVANNAHAFALFDLDLEAGRKQVRARWAELSGRFHPDRLGAEGLGHLRDRVEKVFAALSEAQGILSNKEERAALKAAVESGADPTQPGQDARTVVRNALEAEMLARDADKLLKKGGFARALELYDKARALHAGEAEIEAAAAWCRYQVEGRTPEAAKTALEVLAVTVEDQPMCARAHYYRGLVLLQAHQEELAKVSFADALKADRHFTDAERQLRAMKLNKKAVAQQQRDDNKKKSGIRGLFGRKD